jgi:hypothetical protein
MQVRGAEQERQYAQHGLLEIETQLPQQAKGDQRSHHIHENTDDVADDDAAYRRIVLIPGEDRPVRDRGGDNINGEHEQRLANTVPTEDLSAASVQAELWILVRENLRLRSPQPVSCLQPVHGIRGAHFARLHHECQQSCGQAQKKQRIAQPLPQAGGHR